MNISANGIASLPDRQCPPEYTVRGLREGDEVKLPELIVLADVGWRLYSPEEMDEYLSLPERCAGTRVIECAGELVALCYTTRRADFCPGWGQLDYVCVRPDHRGMHLALVVCTSALRYLESKRYKAVTLTTLHITEQNHQLAPIKTYLSLGLRPEKTQENAAICEEIWDELGWPAPVEWWGGVCPFPCECS